MWMSRSPAVMVELRKLYRYLWGRGMKIAMKHLPSALNLNADRLSRPRRAYDFLPIWTGCSNRPGYEHRSTIGPIHGRPRNAAPAPPVLTFGDEKGITRRFQGSPPRPLMDTAALVTRTGQISSRLGALEAPQLEQSLMGRGAGGV
jgi:hypothetical protein